MAWFVSRERLAALAPSVLESYRLALLAADA
jgi:hypothetical protein